MVGRKEKGPNVWSREKSWFGLQASPQKTFCYEIVERLKEEGFVNEKREVDRKEERLGK